MGYEVHICLIAHTIGSPTVMNAVKILYGVMWWWCQPRETPHEEKKQHFNGIALCAKSHMAAPGVLPMRLLLPGFTPQVRPSLSSTTLKAVFAVCLQLLVFAVFQQAWSITGLHNYSTITAAAPRAFNRRNISLISPQLSACSLYRNHTCNNCIMPSAAGVERSLVVHTLAVLWRYFPAGCCNDNLRS